VRVFLRSGTDLDVGAGELLAQELDLLLDGGGRTVQLDVGHGRRDAAAGDGHRQVAHALHRPVHAARLLDVHLGRVDAARLEKKITRFHQ